MLRNLLKLRGCSFKLGKRYSSCIQEPETVVKVLNNCITVATEQTCSPLACLSLFIETGPRFERDCNNGINYFIEHLAFRGFTNQSREQLEHYAHSTGSRLTAHTSQELQRFSVVCLPERIQEATSLLCNIISQLAMDDAEIECARRNICLDMEDADRNYKAVVFENLIQSAFQGTSLGQKVAGPMKNLDVFDKCFAKEYQRVQYQPWRIFFASSGPEWNDCIAANVERHLGSIPVSEDRLDYGCTRYSASSVIYRDDSKDLVHIACALEAPGFLSNDYLSMLVLKNLVGSWSKARPILGAWPELALRCTDTELCKSYETFYLTYRDVGLWGVYFVCGKMEPEDFLYNWQSVLLSMSCHMKEGDFERAKRETVLELCRNRSGVVNSSLDLGKEIVYRGERPKLADYVRAINVITMDNLQSLAYNTIYNGFPVLSAAGPTEGIPEYNRLSAGQYWLRW